MHYLRYLSLFGVGILTGSALALQSVINPAMERRVGVYGTLLIMTAIGVGFSIITSLLFPDLARLRNLPGKNEWYLYLGGVFGLVLMITPIFLVPRIGATGTLTAIVLGQLILALILDHYGVFGTAKIAINAARAAGVALVVIGAYLISR